jgi:putative ABC transport system ATP-binding protein
MFALSNVRHRYGGQIALAIDQWEAAQGEHWLVIGPSGSGKTTLLHLLAGVLRAQEGSISVAGQDLGQLSQTALDRFRGQHVGIVLQRLHLVASLTVAGNLLLAQYCAGLEQDRRRVDAVLEDLGIADKADAYPRELSHGQAQRVAVARAVLNRPQLLLADEPTSNLDDANCAQALDLLVKQAQQCGASLLIATHDARLKARIDRHRTLPTES